MYAGKWIWVPVASPPQSRLWPLLHEGTPHQGGVDVLGLLVTFAASNWRLQGLLETQMCLHPAHPLLQGTVRVSSTLPKHLVQLVLLFVKVTLEGSVVRRDGSREWLYRSGIAHLWKISEVTLAYLGLSSSQGGPSFLICLVSKFLPFLALVLFFPFSPGPVRYWYSLYLRLWLCVQAGFHPPSLLVAEELVAVEQVFWIWGPRTMGCLWAPCMRVYENS